MCAGLFSGDSSCPIDRVGETSIWFTRTMETWVRNRPAKRGFAALSTRIAPWVRAAASAPAFAAAPRRNSRRLQEGLMLPFYYDGLTGTAAACPPEESTFALAYQGMPSVVPKKAK
jgi:hypothetical protein